MYGCLPIATAGVMIDVSPVIIVAFITVVTLRIKQHLLRRKIDKLNEKIDAVMTSLPERPLDFFRSTRMKAYLTNSGYIDVLCEKVDRIKQLMPSKASPQNEETQPKPQHK